MGYKMNKAIAARTSELLALDTESIRKICSTYYHAEDIGFGTKDHMIILILNKEFGSWNVDYHFVWNRI